MSANKSNLCATNVDSSASSGSRSSTNHDQRNEKLLNSCYKLTKQFEYSLNDEKQLNNRQLIENLLQNLKKLCNHNKSYLENLFSKLNLTSILAKLLIKFRNCQNDDALTSIKLLILSCLADFCFYERLRNQLINDELLDQLIKAISTETNSNIWSKVCRLSANLCMDSFNIKFFMKNDFILSLAKCVENSQSENSIDLFYSCIRFLKYGCEKSEFKNEILDKRIFVHICKYANKIRTHKNCNNEFIKHYLLILDLWQHPSCYEFVNQIIEGETIDYLIWMYLEYNQEENTNAGGNHQSSFNCKQFSFNLIYNFCKEYDICRAEFGRVNGLRKFFDLINANEKSNEINGDTNQRLIEIICFSCKEGVNRFRFKEQNMLNELINLLKIYSNKELPLTQKLINSICSFAHDADSLNYFLQNSLLDYLIDYLYVQMKTSDGDNIESSFNIFSNNYFQLRYDKLNKCESHTNCLYSKEISYNELVPPKSDGETNDANRINANNNNNKRKISTTSETSIHRSISANQMQQQQQYKRIKYSYSPIVLIPPPPTFNEQDNFLSPTYSNPFSPISQTESVSGLSPRYSPTASVNSPPPTVSNRSNSAIMFDSDEEAPSPVSNADQSQSTAASVTIKFSPSVSLVETLTNNDENNTEFVLEEEEDGMSIGEKSVGDTYSKLSSSPALSNYSDTTRSIDSANSTEACIFYVFSILSHNQTNYLLSEKFFTLILNYLKYSKVKNPRALRILNRLTKNPQCFQFFLVNQFSYRIKLIFETLLNEDEFQTGTTIEHSKIEHEMQFYLNSNKVFFDSNIFPKLSSIEFQLNQNLKSHCISSSDNCYQDLLSIMKYGTLKERQSCALQIPFILRNRKALENIMVQLNGLDLILDCLIIKARGNGEDQHFVFDKNFYKALLCVRKLINFVNFKQNRKKLKDNYERTRANIQNLYQHLSRKTDKCEENSKIEFELIDEQMENQRLLKANKVILTENFEYFNRLLAGEFCEAMSKAKRIELKDVGYDVLKCIFEILNCQVNANSEESSTESEQQNNEQSTEDRVSFTLETTTNDNNNEKITFKFCKDLLETCDRFMLFNIKQYICEFLSFNYLSLCTLNDCYLIACKYNCKYLLNACLEYLLSYDCDKKKFSFNAFIEYCYNFEKLLCISIEHSFTNELRQALKDALIDIIKFNYWKY